MVDTLVEFWPQLSAGIHVVTGLWASGHAVLYKRDVRAALAWVGVIWLVPLVGALLYLLFGVNRIQRRARSLRPGPSALRERRLAAYHSAGRLDEALPPESRHLEALAKLVGQVTHRPLLRGNRVTPLVDGDQAYPAMLDAISQATQSVTLSTFIFGNDESGRRFLAALSDAAARGIEVRVLIDDVGSHYTWPRMVRPLHRAQVRVATFLPTLIPWAFRYSNLRNHRKILVVDGRIGFTGGVNIWQRNVRRRNPPRSIQDLHFRIEGPVVAHLQEIFAQDWEFSTGERLEGEDWFPQIEEVGPALARGVADGPDEDLDKSRMTIQGALSCARSSVVVMTPYFLPDQSLIASLNTAALRGAQVDIVLPEKNNWPLIQWATSSLVWQLLERGCRIWLTPPPFDHSKLMLVDDAWSLLGSVNWDPRSLRLNFEFNVEFYDRGLAGQLHELVRNRISQARRIELADADGRSLPARLRDGVARLASPYL